jgi:hypothetical protein
MSSPMVSGPGGHRRQSEGYREGYIEEKEPGGSEDTRRGKTETGIIGFLLACRPSTLSCPLITLRAGPCLV